MEPSASFFHLSTSQSPITAVLVEEQRSESWLKARVKATKPPRELAYYLQLCCQLLRILENQSVLSMSHELMQTADKTR